MYRRAIVTGCAAAAAFTWSYCFAQPDSPPTQPVTSVPYQLACDGKCRERIDFYTQGGASCLSFAPTTQTDCGWCFGGNCKPQPGDSPNASCQADPYGRQSVVNITTPCTAVCPGVNTSEASGVGPVSNNYGTTWFHCQ